MPSFALVAPFVLHALLLKAYVSGPVQPPPHSDPRAAVWPNRAPGSGTHPRATVDVALPITSLVAPRVPVCVAGQAIFLVSRDDIAVAACGCRTVREAGDRQETLREAPRLDCNE
jgi:hypothetical protein